MNSLKHILLILPKKPGVYLFKNKTRNIIYVGKAKNLKSRVASYFRKSANLEPAKKIMVEQIVDIEYIMVDSETEALFLETTLIKKYHPRFNIVMRDDKYFVYIKINLAEDFPSVSLVRRITKDRARYFGPYTSALKVRSTIKYLKRIFPIKTCSNKPTDPCFEYQINRCLGHQTSPESKSEYQNVINGFIRFMEGKSEGVLNELHCLMKQYAEKQMYEKAALCRDRIEAIERVIEKQKVVLLTNENTDFISLGQQAGHGCINLFTFREGKLISRKNFILKNIEDKSEAELLASFIEQYYTQSTEHPKQIVTKIIPERISEIQKLLQLKIITAQRGQRARILKLGEANALDTLVKTSISLASEQKKTHEALIVLTKKLKLKRVPRRIETYDISNIQGENAVGSMVVFEMGQPKKSDYRKFKIKTVSGANDPAMLAEIIERRFSHLSNNKSKWPRPDLIILDGGKGQLNVVRGVFTKFDLDIPLAALAKRNEEIYLPGKPHPIVLLPDSPALFLIQRMRDEAHRFAIGFYRKTHRRQSIKSQLDEIPGIGPKTKKKLIQKFGSVLGIKRASDQELTNCVGSRLTNLIRDRLGD